MKILYKGRMQIPWMTSNHDLELHVKMAELFQVMMKFWSNDIIGVKKIKKNISKVEKIIYQKYQLAWGLKMDSLTKGERVVDL